MTGTGAVSLRRNSKDRGSGDDFRALKDRLQRDAFRRGKAGAIVVLRYGPQGPTIKQGDLHTNGNLIHLNEHLPAIQRVAINAAHFNAERARFHQQETHKTIAIPGTTEHLDPVSGSAFFHHEGGDVGVERPGLQRRIDSRGKDLRRFVVDIRLQDVERLATNSALRISVRDRALRQDCPSLPRDRGGSGS